MSDTARNLELARLALEQGRPERALPYVEKALSAGETAEALALAVVVHHRLKDDAAIGLVARLCALQPGDAAVLRLRAEVLLAHGDREGARVDAHTAARIDPTNPMSHALLAATGETGKEVERAIRRAIELAPSDPAVRRYLATVIRSPLSPLSERLAAEALELDPGDLETVALNARLASTKGPWTAGRALGDHATLVRLDPGDTALAVAHHLLIVGHLILSVLMMFAGPSLYLLVSSPNPRIFGPINPANAHLFPAIFCGLGLGWLAVIMLRAGGDGRADMRSVVSRPAIAAVIPLLMVASVAAGFLVVRPLLWWPWTAVVVGGSELLALLLLVGYRIGIRPRRRKGPPSKLDLLHTLLLTGFFGGLSLVLGRLLAVPPPGSTFVGPVGWTIVAVVVTVTVIHLGWFVIQMLHRRRWRNKTEVR